jgi:tetratricopeptide (TPR) repeat protein
MSGATEQGRFMVARPGSDAEARYRALLDQDADNGRAMLMLGLVLADGRGLEEAETLLMRYLGLSLDGSPDAGAAPPQDRSLAEIAAAIMELGRIRQRLGDHRAAVLYFEKAVELMPELAPLHNDFGVSLHRLGELDKALAAFGRALAFDPRFTIALSNRGQILVEAHRARDAVADFERWSSIDPDCIEAWIHLGNAALAIPDTHRAEAAVLRALKLDPTHVEANVTMANIMDHDNRDEEAAHFLRQAARHHGIAAKPCLGAASEARVLVIGGAGICNLSLQFLLDKRRFDTVVAYLQPPGSADSVIESIKRMPKCDVVVNCVVDSDRGADFLDKTLEFCDNVGCPVINRPDERIRRTSRDGIAALFHGINGLTVPRMRRLERGALGEFAAQDGAFDRPLLIRPIGTHGGKDFERLESARDLDAYLSGIPSAEFYLSEFHDYRSADGYYRKYRLIFVDREIYPYHLTIGPDWKQHYFRVDMGAQSWMRPEEEAFLADWRSVFHGQLGEAVTEAARRLDLDYAGMDCTISEGQVLVFESNPAMLVHLMDSPVEFPYRHKYVPRIFDAFSAMLLRRKEAR